MTAFSQFPVGELPNCYQYIAIYCINYERNAGIDKTAYPGYNKIKSGTLKPLDNCSPSTLNGLDFFMK